MGSRGIGAAGGVLVVVAAACSSFSSTSDATPAGSDGGVTEAGVTEGGGPAPRFCPLASSVFCEDFDAPQNPLAAWESLTDPGGTVGVDSSASASAPASLLASAKSSGVVQNLIVRRFAPFGTTAATVELDVRLDTACDTPLLAIGDDQASPIYTLLVAAPPSGLLTVTEAEEGQVNLDHVGTRPIPPGAAAWTHLRCELAYGAPTTITCFLGSDKAVEASLNGPRPLAGRTARLSLGVWYLPSGECALRYDNVAWSVR